MVDRRGLDVARRRSSTFFMERSIFMIDRRGLDAPREMCRMPNIARPM
jgi:hypothetical protein